MADRARTVRIAGRDQTLLHMRTIGFLSPLQAPSPTQVRGALRRLARLYPEHRMLRRLDRDNVRWITVPAAELDAHCDRMVVDLTHGLPSNWSHDTSSQDGSHSAAPDAAETMFATLYGSPPSDIPVQFVVGVDFTGIIVEHACLDGLSITSIWSEVLRSALAEDEPAAIAVPSIRAPLLRALDNYYRRSPKRILATLRAPHSTPPVEPPPAATLPWRPDFAVVSVRAERAALEAIRKWRLEHAPGITRAMVLFCAARAALEQVGLTPSSPGMYVIADIRRYLPSGARLDGNFASAVYVAPANPTDPAALSGAVEEAFSAARPLATMALVAATASRRRRHAGGTPTRIGADARPVPSLVYSGRLRGLDKLPWTGEAAERRAVIGSTPGGAEGISVFLSEMHGCLDVTATFHASTFDRATVMRALELIAKDPAGVLDASRAAQPS